LPMSRQPSSWWRADTHADRRPFLLARGRIRAALRAWFEAEGFTEVETSALQVSPGNELNLFAFATELVDPDGTRRRLYLHTSPEFALKKLLAAGEERVFTFAQVFRNRERGPLHHPAFTMLEWYRAREPYERLMEDCAHVVRIAAEAVGGATLRRAERSADARVEPDRITVAQAFDRFAGIDLLASLHDSARRRHALAAQAKAAGIRLADDDTWADIFSRVLIERIEPRLGDGRATVLSEYPADLAALARPKPSDPRLAERFELYACGVELANAFGELTDPHLQRQRLAAEMVEKERIFGERYPIDEDFLAALAHVPPSCGAALGFDRLVMLATGAARIEQVLWTPVVE
jgi:elongation factor P--(R)-beta-lysine ligase